MTDLQIFNNPDFGEVRVVEMDGEPWFVGKDVAAPLGYANPSKAIVAHVDDEDKRFEMMPATDSQNGNLVKTALISEAGVYSLILSSKLESAKRFKRWVIAEVLPAIRKHGAYIAPNAQPPATLDGAALQTFSDAIVALSTAVQTLTQRMDAQDRGQGGMRALPPMPEKNPFEDNPFADDSPKPSSPIAKKLWMKLVTEKLDLLAARYGKGHNAILSKIYQDMEEHFDTVMDDERYRTMEEQGLEKCSVLLAIFFDPELRDYFQRYVDYNLAPENRGW